MSIDFFLLCISIKTFSLTCTGRPMWVSQKIRMFQFKSSKIHRWPHTWIRELYQLIVHFYCLFYTLKSTQTYSTALIKHWSTKRNKTFMFLIFLDLKSKWYNSEQNLILRILNQMDQINESCKLWSLYWKSYRSVLKKSSRTISPFVYCSKLEFFNTSLNLLLVSLQYFKY